MLNGIVSFIKNLGHTTNREMISDNINMAIGTINDDALAVLTNMIDNPDLDYIYSNKLLTTIGGGVKTRHKDNLDVLIIVRSLLKAMVDSKSDLIKSVYKNIPETLTKKTMTIKQGALLKIIEDYVFVSLYSMDLLYYILIANNTKQSNYPKKKLENIFSNISLFINIINLYGDGKLSKLIKDVDRLSTELVDVEDDQVAMLSKSIDSKTTSTLGGVSTGFTGNPIYFIRMLFADISVKKYENNKDKKRLAELRLLELQTENENEPNPKLQKQIEYYEEKILKLEHWIDDYEKDLDK